MRSRNVERCASYGWAARQAAALLLAASLVAPAAQSQQQSEQGVLQQSGSESPTRVSVRPADIISDNLDHVAASPEQIIEVLNKEAGLMVELKRLLAQDAGISGQILEESDLTDGAVAERLRSDLRARALATRLLQRYGYLVPRLNPDSDLEEDSIPKCLLPIRGIPMLQIWFDLCRRHGVDEVLINLHSHAEAVRRFIEKNNNGLRVYLFEEQTLLGSAGTLLANRNWVREEASFWVFFADVLTTADLNRMLEFHRGLCQIATIGVYEVPDPSRCGIVQIDEAGIVRNFVEKPAVPFSHSAFSGLMLATPLLLDSIPEQSPVDLGFDVLPRLVGRMAAYRISDYILDIGTPENYRAAQLNWPGILNSGITEVRPC